MKRLWILNFLFFLTATSATAGPGGYICTTKAEYVLNHDGVLNPARGWPTLRFHIDRDTGKVDGSMFASTWNSENTVINRGGDNAVFALSIDYLQGGVALVIVKEFVDGPLKPFVASTSLGTYSGVCE